MTLLPCKCLSKGVKVRADYAGLHTLHEDSGLAIYENEYEMICGFCEQILLLVR